MARHGGHRVEGARGPGEEGLVVVTVDQRLGHLVRARGTLGVGVGVGVGLGLGVGVGHHAEARLLSVG